VSGEGRRAGEARRLDQWLWFARFARSRSLAARLIAAGAVTLNGAAARKANQAVRVGDRVGVPQGGSRRSVRVAALGTRRGPAPEARLLYDEIAPPVPLAPAAEWVSLFAEDPVGEEEGRQRSGAPP
jgi:ribosome-associated heat shock protein Hsp15